jgi:hypothetical protein
MLSSITYQLFLHLSYPVPLQGNFMNQYEDAIIILYPLVFKRIAIWARLKTAICCSRHLVSSVLLAETRLVTMVTSGGVEIAVKRVLSRQCSQVLAC